VTSFLYDMQPLAELLICCNCSSFC